MTLPPEYFEHVYGNSDDPWNFETSPYEAAKYARTLAALPRERARRTLEVGCSIGVLSAQLARRTDELIALDVNDKALARTARRLADLGLSAGAHTRRGRLPDSLPTGPFDLIVLSEVLYYLSPADLGRALDEVLARLSPGGHLLLVHWTPHVHDYPQTGDAVHEATLRRAGPGGPLRHTHAERWGDEREGYRLDLFERTGEGGEPSASG